MTEHQREYMREYMRKYYAAHKASMRETQKKSRKELAKRNFAEQSWMSKRRLALGYTQAELAELCGTTQMTISMLETGQRTLATFYKREKVYEVLGAEA